MIYLFNFAKTSWLIVGITLLFWFALNGILGVVVYTANIFLPAKSNTFVLANEKSWSEGYIEEFMQAKAHWVPYLGWKRKSKEGKYINIDHHGIRRSKNYSEDGMKIFMFGGSTMWGSGARDDYTIPSFVAHYLNKKGIAAQVTNYGETGYVSTQEVIKLFLLLNKGEIPDCVVFYDGVNDIVASYQSGMVGFPQNVSKRNKEFNILRRYTKLSSVFIKETLRKFPVSYAVNDFLWHFEVKGRSIELHDDLNLQIVEQYLRNVATVKRLAETYGFKAFFYWQPTLLSKTKRTRFEKSLFDKGHPYHESFAAVYKVMEEKSHSDVMNISNIFKDHQQTLFYDWVHVLEAGNDMIAKRMSLDLINFYEAKK